MLTNQWLLRSAEKAQKRWEKADAERGRFFLAASDDGWESFLELSTGLSRRRIRTIVKNARLAESEPPLADS